MEKVVLVFKDPVISKNTELFEILLDTMLNLMLHLVMVVIVILFNIEFPDEVYGYISHTGRNIQDFFLGMPGLCGGFVIDVLNVN